MWLAAAFLSFSLVALADVQAEGMKALEEQRWAEAAALFRKAVEKAPEDYAAHFHLALALSLLQQDGEAIAEYRKVLELKPGLYEAELNLGILLLRRREACQARPLLESAARSRPGETKALLWAGQAQVACGDGQKGEETFRAVLAKNPKSAEAELGLGRALAAQGRFDEAIQHYHSAVALDATLEESLLELAAQLEQARRLPDAAALYQRFPHHPAARERLGSLLIELNRAQEAIPLLEAAVAQSPTIANRYALANAYLAIKDSQRALPLLAAVVAAAPGEYRLRMAYARVLREQKKLEEAAAQFREAAQLEPQKSEPWSDLAGVLIVMGRDAEAVQALDRVRSLGGEAPGHHFLRALVLDRNRQYEAALASYERFLQLSEGKFPDEEFQARQRVRILKRELSRR